MPNDNTAANSITALLAGIAAIALNGVDLAILDFFYNPDKPCKDTEIEDLVHMLYNCDERSIQVVRATVKALLGTYQEQI